MPATPLVEELPWLRLPQEPGSVWMRVGGWLGVRALAWRVLASAGKLLGPATRGGWPSPTCLGRGFLSRSPGSAQWLLEDLQTQFGHLGGMLSCWEHNGWRRCAEPKTRLGLAVPSRAPLPFGDMAASPTKGFERL